METIMSFLGVLLILIATEINEKEGDSFTWNNFLVTMLIYSGVVLIRGTFNIYYL